MSGSRRMKPRVGRKSHFKQGYYDVRKSSKYYGEIPVIYRSGLEFKFMTWCEHSPRVKRWTSEPTGINYTCPETGRQRKYYIDFIVEFVSGERFLVEVKPYSQMKDAEMFSKEAKRRQQLPRIDKSNATAAKNDAKWKYAKKWAQQRDMKFTIITERFKFR